MRVGLRERKDNRESDRQARKPERRDGKLKGREGNGIMVRKHRVAGKF